MLAARDPVLRGGWFAAHRGLRAARWVLTCLLLIFVIIVAVPMSHTSSPPTVSYSRDLAVMTREARYPVVAPAGLPLSWAPVSSGVALGGANGPGTATWQLGYVTPSGMLASVEQSDAAAAAFIRRMTNSGTPQPPVRHRRAGVARFRKSRPRPAFFVPNASRREHDHRHGKRFLGRAPRLGRVAPPAAAPLTARSRPGRPARLTARPVRSLLGRPRPVSA